MVILILINNAIAQSENVDPTRSVMSTLLAKLDFILGRKLGHTEQEKEDWPSYDNFLTKLFKG